MAKLLRKTEEYAYIEFGVKRAMYDRWVAQFDGSDNLALREIRYSFNANLQRIIERGIQQEADRAADARGVVSRVL